MKKGAKRLLIIVICISSFVCISGIIAYSTLKGSAVSEDGGIYLPEEATYQTLMDSLKSGQETPIKKVGLFDRTARMLGLDKGVKPGYYRLKKGTSYINAVRIFQRGLQTPVRVTFNNIRTLEQLSARVSQQLQPDSAAFAQTLLASATASNYGFDKQTFIAMFIPDTYEMYWTSTPEGFIDRMKKEYDRFWNEERTAKLAETGLSREEAITLASIVYEETKMSDEMPTVAGVYINRLNQRIKLQADPTVKFAVGDFALRRVLFRHLEVDSPYNTYMYEGLPPGPICMPSVKAIDAVLNYQKHKYIFFCARPDFSGYHNFAVTGSEHERNRQAWIAALNRAGIR